VNWIQLHMLQRDLRFSSLWQNRKGKFDLLRASFFSCLKERNKNLVYYLQQRHQGLL
jgi:hypothetical protein